MAVKSVTLGITELKSSAILGCTAARLTSLPLFSHQANGNIEGHGPHGAVVQIQQGQACQEETLASLHRQQQQQWQPEAGRSHRHGAQGQEEGLDEGFATCPNCSGLPVPGW